jgi:hypothetical protein
MTTGKALTILVVGALAVSLSACGRRTMPKAPDDAFYPQIYPALTKADKSGPMIDVYGLQSQVDQNQAQQQYLYQDQGRAVTR